MLKMFHHRKISVQLFVLAGMAMFAVWVCMGQAASTQPKAARPAADDDDIDFVLKHATPTTAPATSPADELFGTSKPSRPTRTDALPGVIVLSDGKTLPGWLYTTAEKDFDVFIDADKRWVHVPFLNVLSITAVVDEEKMEPEWRWKEMGVPEKVFTGREYPTRRFRWKFHLIDDSTLTGVVKGQPVWLELGQAKVGPMLLHERSKGEFSQKLADLVYVKQIFVSKRLMDAVLKQ
ncbi:MAG: hypothetical protein EHM48_07685 [Planctomycetaceae bacterium]|nr:MAG: hypothetical protein EHM48_07685 [Planctomycetaceae bacterium]